MNILEYIESINISWSGTHRTGCYYSDEERRVRHEKVGSASMTDIYRYLIFKDPTILTKRGALAVFKSNDEDLSEEVIRILQTNQSPVLFKLYRNIVGSKMTHKRVIERTPRTYVNMNIMVDSYITGEPMRIKDHHQEWYSKVKLNYQVLISIFTFAC